jgi:hypothetical protein
MIFIPAHNAFTTVSLTSGTSLGSLWNHVNFTANKVPDAVPHSVRALFATSRSSSITHSLLVPKPKITFASATHILADYKPQSLVQTELTDSYQIVNNSVACLQDLLDKLDLTQSAIPFICYTRCLDAGALVLSFIDQALEQVASLKNQTTKSHIRSDLRVKRRNVFRIISSLLTHVHKLDMEDPSHYAFLEKVFSRLEAEIAKHLQNHQTMDAKKLQNRLTTAKVMIKAYDPTIGDELMA